MMYERKVRYLDYREGGERVRCGGFLKLEARDGRLRMELSVTGLHHTDSYMRDVTLCGREREGSVGKIEIVGGQGRFVQQWRNLENIGGSGLGYRELQGIRIALSAGREISCGWQAAEQIDEGKGAGQAIEKAGKGKHREEEFEVRRKPDQTDHKDMPGNMAARDGVEGNSVVTEEVTGTPDPPDGYGFPNELEERGSVEKIPIGKVAEREMRNNQDGEGWSEKTGRESIGFDRGELTATEDSPGNRGRNHGRTYGDERYDRETSDGVQWKADGAKAAEPQKQPVRLLEDKWPQLWAIYPHICPFQDQREYLSIGPSDFVLFPSACYRMVNNSFLLHGYYNYRHLILARVERKGEHYYYIGVPGNFYEREKQVAIMFGFESFECAEEPAQPGDFGYYMMRTEI